MERIERYRGCLLGMAAGDALGAQVEFMARGTFPSQREMTGGGPWGLAPGQWTDDTIMAMCTAEALVEHGGWDPKAVMGNYLRWYRQGHWSPKGRCFDIGGTTRGALQRYEQRGDPYSGGAAEHNASNGSIMRLAPVPLAYAADPVRASELSGLSSKTTHAHPLCVDACRLLGSLLAHAVRRDWAGDKEGLLAAAGGPANFGQRPLQPLIAALAAGGYRSKAYEQLSGSGYVVATLETALWCFQRCETFEEGLVATIDVGDDTDTTGAVYGQIAGAFHGEGGIPGRWRERVWRREAIERYSAGLLDLSGPAGH